MILIRHITGSCTFERGLLEDLHGVELVGIRRGYLSHQEHLQITQQTHQKNPVTIYWDWESESVKEEKK